MHSAQIFFSPSWSRLLSAEIMTCKPPKQGHQTTKMPWHHRMHQPSLASCYAGNSTPSTISGHPEKALKIAISHAVPVCQATAWTEKAILRRTHGTSPKFYLTIQLCKIKPIIVTDIRDISTTRETALCWNCAATTKLPSIYPIVYKCYGTIPHRITWLVANTAHKPAMGNNVPASSTWDGSM